MFLFLDQFEDFLPMHTHFRGSLNTQLDGILVDLQHFDNDTAIDHDALIEFAGKDQHGGKVTLGGDVRAGRVGGRIENGRVALAGATSQVRRGQGGNEILHQLQRLLQQVLVLPGALADPLKQFVIFLNQGADQGPVLLRKQGNQSGERSIFGLLQGPGEFLLNTLPALPGGLNGRALRLDRRAGLRNGLAGSLDRQFLRLVVEQGQHLAVLLQLVAQSFDQNVQIYRHEQYLAGPPQVAGVRQPLFLLQAVRMPAGLTRLLWAKSPDCQGRGLKGSAEEPIPPCIFFLFRTPRVSALSALRNG